MWQKIQGLIFALLVMVTFADHHEGHIQADCASEDYGELLHHKLIPINANFAFGLYNKLSSLPDSKDKNIFFSPLSISLALSMLAQGAKEETHSEIFNTLGYSSLSEEEVNEEYEHLLQALEQHREAVLLKTGGGLAVREGFNPIDKFLKDLQQFYHTEAFSVDFSQPKVAVDVINKFIASKTNNTITDMMKSLEPETILVLINYMYFKGNWKKPFSVKATRKGQFSVNKNTTVTVDIITKNDHLDVLVSNNITLIKLPYDGNISMVIILPSEGKLGEVEKHITKDQLKDWICKSRQRYVDLSLPKFSISAFTDLGDTLKDMGIVEAFSNKANLSGISEDKELKVSKVLHKAFVNVDEKGTEAAAATTIEVIERAFPFPININKPFLFLILEENVKSILFMGKIVNPTIK